MVSAIWVKAIDTQYPYIKTMYDTRNKICEYRTKMLLPLALNTVHITWNGPVIPEITSKTIDKY